jgi:hypothetical protein
MIQDEGKALVLSESFLEFEFCSRNFMASGTNIFMLGMFCSIPASRGDGVLLSSRNGECNLTLVPKLSTNGKRQ